VTFQFERDLTARGPLSGSHYASQKEHWLRWLSEYHGPGYYSRKNSERSAEFVYNHINYPAMVLWLGEASGVPKSRVVKAKRAALSAGKSFAAQTSASSLAVRSLPQVSRSAIVTFLLFIMASL
jgi:hypothetical protein